MKMIKVMLSLLLCISMCACSNQSNEDKQAKTQVITETVTGHNGELTLTVTFENDEIKDISLKENVETASIGLPAFEMMKEKIIAYQSTDVDLVSGATVTSAAVRYAVAQAVKEANVQLVEQEKIVNSTETEVSTDLLVIGSGMAGLMAANLATEQGIETLVIEKQGVYGGTSAKCDGIMMGAGTEYQKQNGIEDDAENYFQELTSVMNKEIINSDLLKVVAANAGEVVDYVMNKGTEFVAINSPRRNLTERAHYTANGGSDIVLPLIQSLKDNEKATMMLNTQATELLMEEGKVIGAKAIKEDGTELMIYSNNVILATGNMMGNQAMRTEHVGDYLKDASTSNLNQGDGYVLAQNAGAKMIDSPYSLAMAYDLKGVSWLGLDNEDLVRITPDGNRIVDESVWYTEKIQAAFDASYEYYYILLDSEDYESYQADFEGRFDDDCFVGENIKDLAEKLNMDPETLETTMKQYNEYCEKGIDEQFNKPEEYLDSYDLENKIYAMRLTVDCVEVFSGPQINEKAQVLDKNGNCIAGLYAAGSLAMAQLCDDHYMGSGYAMATSGVLAKVAVENILGE